MSAVGQVDEKHHTCGEGSYAEDGDSESNRAKLKTLGLVDTRPKSWTELDALMFLDWIEYLTDEHITKVTSWGNDESCMHRDASAPREVFTCSHCECEINLSSS